MSGVGRKKNKDRGIGGEGSDAVEELLHAAEDDMLLSISIDSHAARSNHLEADLARRLQALKIPSSSPNITKKPLPPMQQIPPVVVDDELKMILGADLSSRFAALKASSSSSSSSSTFSSSKQVQGLSWKFEDDTGDDDVDDGGVSKKEVDKVIQWAMDAARLDPSPASDDDDELDSDDDELDSDDEDKDERKKLKKGEVKKKKDQSLLERNFLPISLFKLHDL